ncbi:MAG TPA: bifunctional riboflavin kinase/FAD synthetase [Prolixibacteraceae bacterium]|nr:bifunctional riboflavin kinase/FAD synthetase [Prolixibacteraceae bacterium]HPR86298.1 bifunctional riboflavin kinase/FAD synthetase [Prolixibacteraceae bacterium]
MKIHRDLENFKAKNPVVTIGTFDGVHLGHRKIISRLQELARAVDGESVIFTFDPHPRKVVAPSETNLRLLTSLDEKISLFERAGIDHLVVYPFTLEFAQLSYEQFVEQILVGKIHTKSLVVGYDHKFGKGRAGDFDLLKSCADRLGFQIEKLDVLLINESNVSSTKIREAIQLGDFETANAYLGYQFTLHGTVVEGQKIGRTINYPTANVDTSDPDKIIPGYGVYAVRVSVRNQEYRGMLNIGSRPTVNHNADHRTVEVNILDFDDDIYGEPIEVVFYHKLREEQKFASLDALKEQLAKDRVNTNAFFSALERKKSDN